MAILNFKKNVKHFFFIDQNKNIKGIVTQESYFMLCTYFLIIQAYNYSIVL